MKRFFIVVLAVITVNFLKAQNVGIGTTAPNAKAALEINSTTKGLLIPSMTTSQRLAITSATPAPSGLMVYDTDRDEFYHYNGSSWSPILNGSYWTRPVASRKRISNNLDSVGIGTVSPTEWLDVDGNIRSRNNLLADNNVTASGGVSGASLSTPGNITVAGTSFFNGNVSANSNLSVGGTSLLTGDVTTNSDLIVNNTTATLQLKSSNVNKGFLQLSGDNVRIGTNSGNTTGNMVIRMNGTDRVFVDEVGNVGIGDANPTQKLEVNGNINLTGELIKTSLTGTASLTPYCYGSVFRTGVILHGTSNFSAQKISQGVYRISCTGITPNNSVVLLTSGIRSRLLSTIVSTNYFEVINTGLDDLETDGDFDFVVFKL